MRASAMHEAPIVPTPCKVGTSRGKPEDWTIYEDPPLASRLRAGLHQYMGPISTPRRLATGWSREPGTERSQGNCTTAGDGQGAWQQPVPVPTTYMPRQQPHIGQATQEAGPRHSYIKQSSAM